MPLPSRTSVRPEVRLTGILRRLRKGRRPQNRGRRYGCYAVEFVVEGTSLSDSARARRAEHCVFAEFDSGGRRYGVVWLPCLAFWRPNPSLAFGVRWVLWGRARHAVPLRFSGDGAQVEYVVVGGGVVRGVWLRFGLFPGLQIGDAAWGFLVDLMKVGDGGGGWVGVVCRTVHRSY